MTHSERSGDLPHPYSYGYGSKLGTPIIGWLILNQTNICGPLGLPFWPTSILICTLTYVDHVDLAHQESTNEAAKTGDGELRFHGAQILKSVDLSRSKMI